MKYRLTVVLIVFILAFNTNVKSQSCEIFEISGINVFFYPIENQISYSKLNDSTSYSFEKIFDTVYCVKKIVSGTTTNENNYFYKGKSRCQFFKMKNLSPDGVTYTREKRIICLLE